MEKADEEFRRSVIPGFGLLYSACCDHLNIAYPDAQNMTVALMCLNDVEEILLNPRVRYLDGAQSDPLVLIHKTVDEALCNIGYPAFGAEPTTLQLQYNVPEAVRCLRQIKRIVEDKRDASIAETVMLHWIRATYERFVRF